MDKPDEVVQQEGVDGCVVVYYARYADGCYLFECEDGGSSSGGPLHAPHAKFCPGDIPTYEWRAPNV